MNKPPLWRGAGLTDLGRVRVTNQDALAIDGDLGLWVVADGMGGRAGGAVASRVAVEELVKHLRRHVRDAISFSRDGGFAAVVRSAICACDQAIQRQADAEPELSGMGTTLVALHLNPGGTREFTLGHVGDSRAYLLRGTRLMQLTRDHSLVEELIKQGHITREAASTHPQRHVLTRALGIPDQAEPDISPVLLEDGDCMLLCTDGLTNMLGEAEILETVYENVSNPEKICRALVDAANRRGGKDNITVLVVRQNPL